jgi:H+/gluconate symporter-like permease
MPEVTNTTFLIVSAVMAQLVVFATLVFNAWHQGRREARNRQWEIEDRAVLAKKVADTSTVLAAKVVDTSAILADKVVSTSLDLAAKVNETSRTLLEKVDATTTAITAAIHANTVMTERAADRADAAYQEANHVNNKIAAIGELRMNAIHPRKE